MHDMLDCLSTELRKSEVFQFIDDVAYNYQPLIELIPWDKEEINGLNDQNIYINYQCEQNEIHASFSYINDDWQVTCVISILDYGNKLVIENTRMRPEQNHTRIMNTLTSLCYEKNQYHEDGASIFYTITEDNASIEPLEESYVIFDYSEKVRRHKNTSQTEKEMTRPFGKRKKMRKFMPMSHISWI